MREIANILLLWVSPVCAGAVLGAVAYNFLQPGGAVARRKNSPVATGTMLGFTLGVYLLIHFQVGVFLLIDPTGLILQVMGAGLLLAGATVNIMGRLALGSNWANQATIYAEQTLVTGGVYGLVRHPLYGSLVWMFIGAALVYGCATALAATLLIFLPAMYWRAALEERLLAERFPDYPAYRRRTGMLFPRLPGKEPTCSP